MSLFNKIVCCKCGAGFSRRTWREDGVMGCSVNSRKTHYACKPCRDAGFDLIKHAAGINGACTPLTIDLRKEAK